MKDVLEQTGQGWAEPKEEVDYTLPILSGRYSRRCKMCNRKPVHDTNTLQICPECLGEIRAVLVKEGTL